MFSAPHAPWFEFVDVEPSAGVVGEEVVVRWSALHADEVMVEDYGTFPPSGSVPVALEVTRSLRLMARGPIGPPAEAQTRVMRVFNPPVIGFLRIPPPPGGLSVLSPSAQPGVRDELAETLARAPRGLPPSPGMPSPGSRVAGDRRWLGFTRTGDFSAGSATITGWGKISPLLAGVGHPRFPLAASDIIGSRMAGPGMPRGGRDPARGREETWGRATAWLRRRERRS